MIASRSKVTRPLWSPLLAPFCVAVTLAVAGCAGTPMAPTVDKSLINTYDATKAGVKIRWYRQPKYYNNTTAVLEHIWRVGSNLYISSSDNWLYCLDSDTGTTLWKTNVGLLADIFRPAEAGDYLVVLNRISGVLIDRQSGKIFKRAKLDFVCTTDPLVVGGTISVGSGADYFYGLYVDLFTAIKFRVHSEASLDAFVAQPIVAGGRRVIAASQSGLLWCVDPEFGSVVWTYRKVTGQVMGGLGADSRNFYVPSMDNKVFAFDSVDSGYHWDTHFEGTLNQTLVATKGGQLLVPATGKGLYCVETEKGTQQWLLPDATQIVSLSATHVQVVGSDGEVKVVRMKDGKVEKSIPLANVKFFAKNLHSATIYAITADGQIMAIEPEDTDLGL